MPVSTRDLPWNREPVHRAGLGLPALGRILGVERGPRWPNLLPTGGSLSQPAAVGNLDLQLDQIEPGGGLGDRMFHLQAGVHLQEEEVTSLVRHELDRPRTGVADRLGGQPGCVEQLLPHPGVRSTRGDGASSMTF